MPSVLRPNLKFLASSAKTGNSLSIFLHYDPSAGCLNIATFLRSSLCHRNNLACSLFWNKRFNRGIIGAYHITLAGTLFLGRSPSTSPGSSWRILYRNAPHTGHASIFCTSNPRGQTTFFASYVLAGNSLSFGSIFFIIFSNFSNPLSDTPFFAFHCSNSSVLPSFFLPSSQFGYNNFL